MSGRTPRPTRLGWLPLLAAPVLGVLSVMTVDSWLLLLAGASLGLGIASILLRPRLSDLDVSAQTQARAELGQTVSSRLVVRNTGRRTSPLTRLTHRVPGLEDVTILLEALLPGARAEVSVERTAVARGRTRTSQALLTSSAPLGLVMTEAIVSLPTALTVHPALVPVRLPPPRSGGADSSLARLDRSGVDVHGIREWRAGDEARQVHWRSTARRGRLVVLEREAPRGGALTILIVGPHWQPGWELLVSVVASTGLAALTAGRPISLFAQQADVDPLVEARQVDLLDWCASLEEPELPDRTVIDQALDAVGRGGLLHIAATEAPGPWWTAARALADRARVELQLLPGPWA